MKLSRKTINIVLSIIFFLFALVQLNDPDAILWFLIYFLVSIIIIYSNFKIIPKTTLLAFIILLIGYALFHLSQFLDYIQTEHKEELFGKMVYEKSYLEGSREFLGLLLAVLGVFYQLKRPKELK